MNKIIKVVGAILVKNGLIFCVQRGPGKSLAYNWEFPGGKIEKDETMHQALQRELIEELSIEVELEEKIFESVLHEYDFATIHLTTFIGHIIKGEPELTEHIDMKWLDPKDLLSLNWAPADIPIVRKLKDMSFD